MILNWHMKNTLCLVPCNLFKFCIKQMIHRGIFESVSHHGPSQVLQCFCSILWRYSYLKLLPLLTFLWAGFPRWLVPCRGAVSMQEEVQVAWTLDSKHLLASQPLRPSLASSPQDSLPPNWPALWHFNLTYSFLSFPSYMVALKTTAPL